MTREEENEEISEPNYRWQSKFERKRSLVIIYFPFYLLLLVLALISVLLWIILSLLMQSFFHSAWVITLMQSTTINNNDSPPVPLRFYCLGDGISQEIISSSNTYFCVAIQESEINYLVLWKTTDYF